MSYLVQLYVKDNLQNLELIATKNYDESSCDPISGGAPSNFSSTTQSAQTKQIYTAVLAHNDTT